MAETCPSIKIDNFKYYNNFTIIIKILPDRYQLLNDLPLLYDSMDKSLSLNDLTVNDTPYTQLPNYPDTDYMESANETYANIENTINGIISKIEAGLSGETQNTEVNCDPNDPNFQQNNTTGETVEVVLTDIEGNIVLEVNEEVKKTATKTDCDDINSEKIIEAFDLPTNIDVFNQAVKDPLETICQLPDSALKTTLAYATGPLNQDIDELFEEIKPTELQTALQSSLESLGGLTTEQDLQDYYDDLREKIDASTPEIFKTEQYLGIPLVVFDKQYKVILQIKDKKVEVMNLFGSDLQNLFIDKEVDLGKELIIAFKTNGYQHDLWLIEEGDPTLYHKSITQQKNMTIECIGVDPDVVKRYCGLIIDIQIFTNFGKTIKDYLSQNYYFKAPAGCLAFYDWNIYRIEYNLVYPLPNLDYPVKMFGQGRSKYDLRVLDKVEYTFMRYGYLASFFCSKLLSKDDWSITFWFHIEDEMSINSGLPANDWRMIIEDSINGQSLEYDYYSKMFKLNFATENQMNYVVLKDRWYFCNLKYKKDNQRLTFNIREIGDENKETFQEIVVENENIPEFRLTNMLAKFGDYGFTNFFTCRFGTLALFNREIYDFEEDSIFNSQRIVINQLGL